MQTTNLKIAWVHITSRIKQTIIAVLSVTFGTAMYVFLNSLIAGVDEKLLALQFTTLAHLRIYNDGTSNKVNLAEKVYGSEPIIHIRNAKFVQHEEGIKNTVSLRALVEQQPEVTCTTPQVNINVFFRSGNNRVNGILSGIDILTETKVFSIVDCIVLGSWSKLRYQTDGIIIGYDLARKLSLNLDDNVNVLTADGISHNYQLVGIFRTNLRDIDKSKAYIDIKSARQLVSKNQDYATDLQVSVRDLKNTQLITARLANHIPYRVESWQTANQQLEASTRMRDIVAQVVSITVLLVAAFGIYNIMSMTVNEKVRDIAILKAMGFSSKDITEIFLAQSIVIGIIGGLIGMLLGYIIASIVNHIPFEYGNITHLPMSYGIKEYITAFAAGMIVTCLAGYWPAHQASKIDPIAILRG